MTRLGLFNSPLLLGFDQVERMLDRAGKAASEGYPPYNIEQLGEHRLRITLAVAGFRADELGVAIEENQLLIRGKQTQDESRVFLHRGIAARQFQRSFILAEGLEVRGAKLEHGLLHIELERPAPENRLRIVKIDTPDADGADSARIVGVTGGKPATRKAGKAE